MQDIDRAYLEGVALLDLDERESILEVRGADAEDFLQRMVSCDLRKLTATPEGGTARRGTLMTGKGKLIAPFVLHRLNHGTSEARFWIFVDGVAIDALEAALDKIVILEEVTFHRPEVSLWSLQGPQADGLLQGESVGGDPLPADEFARARVVLGEAGEAWVIRRTRCPQSGWDFVLPRGEVGRLTDHWREAGAVLSDDAAIDRFRVAVGEPRFGIDATDQNLPPEVGYDDAIAYDKGCYAGQEVVARIRTYGHVNRRLCQLRSNGSIETGEELRLPEEDAEKVIGHVTSSAPNPTGDGWIALAVVRYRHAIAGQEFWTEQRSVRTVERVIGAEETAT